MNNNPTRNTWKYTINLEDQVTIEGYNGKETKIVIPSEIDGLPVTEIGWEAFKDNHNIVSVVIPDTVEKIEFSAFYGCRNLTDLVVPESVKALDQSAFHGCHGLVDENGFIIVLNVLYEYLGNAETVTIPSGIETIACSCFMDNEKIKKVILPESIREISYGAFSGCKNLQPIDIPSSECRIEGSDFRIHHSHVECENFGQIFLIPRAEQ